VGSPFLYAAEGKEFDVEYSSWGQLQQQQQGERQQEEQQQQEQQQQREQQQQQQQLGEQQKQQKQQQQQEDLPPAAAAAGSVHNCQYVVQPYTQPGALHSFALKGEPDSCTCVTR
jgi:hypothetical protein